MPLQNFPYFSFLPTDLRQATLHFAAAIPPTNTPVCVVVNGAYRSVYTIGIPALLCTNHEARRIALTHLTTRPYNGRTDILYNLPSKTNSFPRLYPNSPTPSDWARWLSRQDEIRHLAIPACLAYEILPTLVQSLSGFRLDSLVLVFGSQQGNMEMPVAWRGAVMNLLEVLGPRETALSKRLFREMPDRSPWGWVSKGDKTREGWDGVFREEKEKMGATEGGSLKNWLAGLEFELNRLVFVGVGPPSLSNWYVFIAALTLRYEARCFFLVEMR